MHQATNNTSRGWKIFFRITVASVVLLLVFWGYYVFMSVRSVNHWIHSTNQTYGQINGNEETSLWESKAYVILQKGNAFLRSRLQMSANNSIGLSLNLPDSTISLEISGVTVSSMNIKEIDLSRSLKGLNHVASVKLFSEPMKITSSSASIVKKPIIEKIAPKTVEEAAVPDPIPDTMLKEPVFFELWFENGIKLLVLQQENESSLDRRNRVHFLLKRGVKRAGKNIADIIRFKKPEYHPEILIKIPATDARAIYRAIPEYGNVVIML